MKAPPGWSASGPKKPDLIQAFASLGYDCRGESGSFTLRRQTPDNLAVAVKVDIGGWNTTVNAFMQVTGLADGRGFCATLGLPPSRQAVRGQHIAQLPIGGPERWRQIENLALVGALDRSFVREIEAISGPSPAWFTPEAS